MKDENDYGNWTLRRYFTEVFIAAKSDQGAPLTAGTVETYRRSIAQLERIAGRAVTLSEISRELLTEFRTKTLETGVKPRTANDRCKVVMAVVRHWRPNQFPPKDDPLAGELKSLFETHYRPARMRAASASSIVACRGAIRAFSRFLGRPATLADLTDNTVGCFAKTASSGAMQYLLSLWRYAAQQEAVGNWPGPRFRRTSADEPRDGALLDYFESVYLPERLADGDISDETAKQYRAALVAFDRYAAPSFSNRCPQVSQHKLAMFQRWQQDTGVGDKKATDRVAFVRAVARHACPERWLPKDPENPAGDLADDSLAAVYLSHYVPSHPGLRDKTIGQFERACNRFGKFLGHVPTIDDLTDENLGGWMRACLQEGLSVNTVNGYRSKVRSLWQFLAEKRFVERFPTVEKLARPQCIPDAWTEQQLRNLYAACDKMPGTVCEIPAPDWWRAVHRVAWSTGERTGAIFAIRFEWIDDAGNLEIPAEFRKGGRKALLYKLTPEALAAIDRIREPRRELLFPLPNKAGKAWFYNQYQHLLRRAGLPRVPHKSCLQKMRRSFASHVEAAGGNATAALSHSERSVTERSYLDPRIVGQQPAAELLFDLGGEL